MKRLIFLLFLLLPLLANAQRVQVSETMPAPTGDDTTWYYMYYSPDPWSSHFNYRDIDSTNSELYLYGSNFHPDSNIYELLWIDLDLD